MDVLPQDELRRLTPPERLDLISRLWDSLEDEQLPVTATQKDELDRRLETIEQNRAHALPWADVKAELQRRLP